MDCTIDTAALRGLLEAEYAYGQRARDSVRAAPGRAFFAAAKDNPDKLEWYPATADLAGSGDLGFTAGPWIYTAAAGGAPIHGHFLTIWKRDTTCGWQVEFDGGVSHAAPANAEPKLEPNQASYAERCPPSQQLIVDDAVGQAISDFEGTSRQDGFAPGLRTYARTADFCFYTDGEAPMGLAAGTRYLSNRTVLGTWKEDARGRSSDSSLAYSVGVLGDANRHGSFAYVQIWQYAPKVANWGLRILLMNPVAPMSK